MQFIIILLATCLERFFDLRHLLRRFTWFDSYISYVHKQLSRYGQWVMLIALMVAIPLLILILTAIIRWLFFDLAEFIFGLFILVYCFGPENVFHDLEHYFKFKDEQKEKADEQSLAKKLFVKVNSQLVAVIFWYVVLGGFGAVFYRIVSLLRENAIAGKEMQPSLKQLEQIQAILDWIPVRIIGLTYGFCGHFKAALVPWRRYVLTGLHDNQVLLEECGLEAVHFPQKTDQQETLQGLKESRSLVSRALVVYVIIVFILLFIF